MSEEAPLSGLHWMAAALYAAVGAESALGERRGDYSAPDVVRWAPLIAAPVAAAAHGARALWPNQATRKAATLANGLAVGVGAAGVASSVYSALSGQDEPEHWSERVPSLAPLAFAAVGLLGLLLEREEEEVVAARRKLERRARVVERLVPKRKAKLDRIVVHI